MSLNSLNRSMLRLTGMSSGMDTTSMVTSLLQIDQMKVDKQFKAKTTLEWKGDAYRDVNLKLRNFREKYMSVLSPETNIFSSAAYNAFKANMVDETMSKYVGISAGSNAMVGSISIQSIKQLASAAQLKSRDIWNDKATPSLDTKLGAQIDVSDDPENPQMESVFGNGIEWVSRFEPVYETEEAYHDAMRAYTEKFNTWLEEDGNEDKTQQDYFDETGIKAPSMADRNEIKEISFEINGESFTFNSENTINEMMAAVNARSDAGVVMSYSSLTKGFTLTARSTGYDNAIEIKNTLGKFFGDDQGYGGAFGIAEGLTRGENAIMVIDDPAFGELVVERSTNSFAIDGIQYNLKQTFNNAVDENDNAIDNGERIQFNVERDIEPVFEKIKGFIEGYNALIAELQTLVEQRPNKNYSPLTSDEKSQLSETEAEKWEGLAKEGLLYRDSNISGLLSEMRGAFYDTVQGAGRSASDIGLRTTAYDYTAGGKIVIDEDALKSALMNNPEQVKDIFTKIGKNEDGSNNYSESGLVTRISNAMNSYVSNSTDITLSTNTRQVREAESRLEQLEQWLVDREARYWKQFSAMETAMSSLNSQSSWIGSMLGSS